MPFGGNDWLALTREETLEPDMPICDPHHHFWDFRTVRIPYQRYLLHELAPDVNSGHNIRSTVFIETSRDSPDQTNFPNYSPLWVALNYNHQSQGRQMRPGSLKSPAFMGQPLYCQA